MLRQFNGTVLSIGYDTVIVIVACGIFGAALILQMKAGLGEIEWTAGLIQLGAYAAMTIAMATCFYIFSKKTKEKEGG